MGGIAFRAEVPWQGELRRSVGEELGLTADAIKIIELREPEEGQVGALATLSVTTTPEAAPQVEELLYELRRKVSIPAHRGKPQWANGVTALTMAAPVKQVQVAVDFECKKCGFTCGTAAAWTHHLQGCAWFSGETGHQLTSPEKAFSDTECSPCIFPSDTVPCMFECLCGFTCGTEGAFKKHVASKNAEGSSWHSQKKRVHRTTASYADVERAHTAVRSPRQEEEKEIPPAEEKPIRAYDRFNQQTWRGKKGDAETVHSWLDPVNKQIKDSLTVTKEELQKPQWVQSRSKVSSGNFFETLLNPYVLGPVLIGAIAVILGSRLIL